MKTLRFLIGCCLILLQLRQSDALTEVAGFQPTRQVGTYSNSADYKGDLAVDQQSSTYSFADSKNDSVPAWWQVDLKATYVVLRLALTAPYLNFEYVATFEITVDDTYKTNSTALCYKYNNETAPGRLKEIIIQCQQPLIGRYVTVRRFADYKPRYLALAEVQIFAEKYAGNRALFEQTKQSAQYLEYTSDYAVDDAPDSCSMSDTGNYSSPAWWQVDMAGLYSVSKITISIDNTQENFAKEQAYRYLNGIDITVDELNRTDSSHICFIYNNGSGVTPNVPLVISCNQPVEGRFVTIRRLLSGFQPNKLALCDVQVFGEYKEDPPTTASWITETSNLTFPQKFTSVAADKINTDSVSCSTGSCWNNNSSLTYSDIVAIVVGGSMGLLLISAALAVIIFYTCVKGSRRSRK